jgi:heptosyltransferase-2
MVTKLAQIKNILVVRNDRFGEFLLNIPALRALKETFPNAKITLVVNPYVKELAQMLPFIDEIIEWARKRHSLLEKFNLVNVLKRKKIDIAIMLNPSKEFNIFTHLAKIPIRVGYDRKWSFLLTHKIEDKKYQGLKHEIDYNLELVSLIGAETKDKTLSLKLDNSAVFEDLSIEYQDNLIALHPWTSDPLKQWPIDNFYKLAQKLTELPNIKLVVIGGPDELAHSLEFCHNLGHKNLINLTGKTTLKQLASFFKKCRLLISGDSGPVHLAVCVGTPVVAIFRGDIVAKCAKRWGPQGEEHIVIEKNNLSDITVEEVFNKIKERLK